jgi:phosphoribosylamine--glycine ligase
LRTHSCEAGLSCFGLAPAARLGILKAYAKTFMERHGIPTGRYAGFGDFAAALAHLNSVPYPVVIKASGTGGKGVSCRKP